MLRTAVLVVIAMALTAPLFAGDIVAMPTGNTVQPGNIELNAIYWNQAPPSGPGDYIEVGEAFFVRKMAAVDWVRTFTVPQ